MPKYLIVHLKQMDYAHHAALVTLLKMVELHVVLSVQLEILEINKSNNKIKKKRTVKNKHKEQKKLIDLIRNFFIIICI